MPPPRDRADLHTFLGMVAYMRRFIPNCSTYTTPLNGLTSDKRPFVWTPECQRAFEKLKNKLTTAPILQFPSRHSRYKLETDASGTAIGGVLRVRMEQDVFLPVAYKSQHLNASETEYSIHNRELLALYHCT